MKGIDDNCYLIAKAYFFIVGNKNKEWETFLKIGLLELVKDSKI